MSSIIYPMATFLRSNIFCSTEEISKQPALIHFQVFSKGTPGLPLCLQEIRWL